MRVCPECTFRNSEDISLCLMCSSSLLPYSAAPPDTSGDAQLAAQLEQQAAVAAQPVAKKSKKAIVGLETVEQSWGKKFDLPASQAPTSDAIARISMDLKEVMRAKDAMFRVLPERKVSFLWFFALNKKAFAF
jgi:hypothetical protein